MRSIRPSFSTNGHMHMRTIASYIHVVYLHQLLRPIFLFYFSVLACICGMLFSTYSELQDHQPCSGNDEVSNDDTTTETIDVNTTDKDTDKNDDLGGGNTSEAGESANKEKDDILDQVEFIATSLGGDNALEVGESASKDDATEKDDVLDHDDVVETSLGGDNVLVAGESVNQDDASEKDDAAGHGGVVGTSESHSQESRTRKRCPICSLECGSRRNLSIHMSSVHGKKPDRMYHPYQPSTAGASSSSTGQSFLSAFQGQTVALRQRMNVVGSFPVSTYSAMPTSHVRGLTATAVRQTVTTSTMNVIGTYRGQTLVQHPRFNAPRIFQGHAVNRVSVQGHAVNRMSANGQVGQILVQNVSQMQSRSTHMQTMIRQTSAPVMLGNYPRPHMFRVQGQNIVQRQAGNVSQRRPAGNVSQPRLQGPYHRQ